MARQQIVLTSFPANAGGDTATQAYTKVNSNFTELYALVGNGESYTISSTAPESTSAVWIDTGNAYADAYPIRHYIDGAWEPVNPNMTYYDPIGGIISNGRPFTILTWGQSNLAACYYQEYVGARATGYLSSSSTSLNTATIVSGTSVTATIDTGLLYVVGDYINFKFASDFNEFMWGNVTAYNSVSGQVIFTVIYPPVSASSYTNWIVTREFPGDIDKNELITLWDATNNEWVVPDIRSQPIADYPYSYWAWNLSVHGTTNIQTFAKKFVEGGRAIRIVQWRKGGTGLEYWLPGGTGYTNLVLAATNSGVPHFDLIIGAQGEGALSDADNPTAYSSYIEALYEGFIPAIRSELFADESTGLIMPTTALCIATYPIIPASHPADYAIRSLNYSGKNTAWAQGRSFKGIIIPNSPLFTSTTSVNLATATFPVTIFKAVGGTSLVGGGPIIVVSRANNNNFIECIISAHNTGTGELTLAANTLNLMGYKSFNGTGTHTDWDIITQDYIHESVSDHISLGNALYDAYKSLGSDKSAQPISTSFFDSDNSLVLKNRIQYIPSDDTQIDYKKLTSNGLFKTEIFGGPSKIFVTGDGKWRYAASVDGTTTATLDDETFQMGSFGVKAAKGIWFTDYAEASPWANTSIRKEDSTRALQINVGASTSYEAYDSHLKIFMSMDQVNPAIDFYEGGAANSNVFNLAGNLKLTTAGNKIIITEGANGRLGQTTLVTGAKAITISGLTTSSRAFLQMVTPSGTTLTTGYQAVCTTNTLTIQADVAAGTINTADGSTLNYIIYN